MSFANRIGKPGYFEYELQMGYNLEFTKGLTIWIFGGLFPPRKISRTPDRQVAVDRICEALVLYDLSFSPFCAKVRRVIQELNLKIELRSAARGTERARELKREGGMFQIPCLRIEEGAGKVRWLYESEDIKAYLRKNFSH